MCTTYVQVFYHPKKHYSSSYRHMRIIHFFNSELKKETLKRGTKSCGLIVISGNYGLKRKYTQGFSCCRCFFSMHIYIFLHTSERQRRLYRRSCYISSFFFQEAVVYEMMPLVLETDGTYLYKHHKTHRKRPYVIILKNKML